MTRERPRRNGTRVARALAAGVLIALTACEAPQVVIESEPTGANLFRDGVASGTTPARFPAPYFGNVSISLDHPVPDDANAERYEPTRGLVHVPAPGLGLVFPFEIFPLDFVTEAIARVGGLEATRAKFELPARPPASTFSLDDKEVERLIADYQAAAVQR